MLLVVLRTQGGTIVDKQIQKKHRTSSNQFDVMTTDRVNQTVLLIAHDVLVEIS